jgi:hypothetical protein
LFHQYPKVVDRVVEDAPGTIPSANGGVEEIPVDMSRPNPNGMEFDCLYLVRQLHSIVFMLRVVENLAPALRT